MSNEVKDTRYIAAQVATPAGGFDKGELTLHENVVGIVLSGQMGTENDDGSYDEDTLVSFVYRADRAVVDCASAGADEYPAGSLVAYDVGTGGQVVQEADMDRDTDVLCGVVLKSASSGDTTVEITLIGDMGYEAQILEEKLESTVLEVHDASIAIADVNSGYILLAGEAGYKYDIVGYRVVVTGASGEATDFRISDSSDTVDAVTIAQAAATNDAIIGSHGAEISNVTPNIPVELTDGEGIKVRKTGSDEETTTELNVSVLYKRLPV